MRRDNPAPPDVRHACLCLAPDDPPPLELCFGEGGAPVLLTCDHASTARAARARHARPHRRRSCRAISAGTSARPRCRGDLAPLARCAGDPRGLFAPRHRLQPRSATIRPRSPRRATASPFPAIARFPPTARAARQRAIFAPYHAAIADWLEARLARGERAGAAVDPQLHAGDGRQGAALACRHPVGRRSAHSGAAARGACAPIPRSSSATTSLIRRASRRATRCAITPSRAACRMSRSSCART